MPDNTPIAGLRYTLLTDGPANIETSTKNLADDLDTQVVPRYTTTTARDAAITSPIEGQLAYVSAAANGLPQFYDGSGWVNLQRAPLFAWRGTSINSSTTTFATSGLTLAMEASRTYRLEAYLVVDGATAADMKIRFTFPTGTGMSAGMMSITTGTLDDIDDGKAAALLWTTTSPTNQFDIPVVNSGTAVVCTHIKGIVESGGTPGNLDLEFAQLVASGTVTIATGSWLMLERVS